MKQRVQKHRGWLQAEAAANEVVVPVSSGGGRPMPAQKPEPASQACGVVCLGLTLQERMPRRRNGECCGCFGGGRDLELNEH